MNYNAMVSAEKSCKELHQQLRQITYKLLKSLHEKRSCDSTELKKFVEENLSFDFNGTFILGTTSINGLHVVVCSNDVSLCKEVLERGAKPNAMNMGFACRFGYTEIASLLLTHYQDPSENDIALWKQTAILNGHNNIAYLIDRLLKEIYLQFSQSDTAYFIRVINTALKYTPGNNYMDKSEKCRPTKVILQEMLEHLTRSGYIPYNMEYLNVLKKSVQDSISIYKLFHLGAEDRIDKAISYYNPYHEGMKETDKRTPTGALLVTID